MKLDRKINDVYPSHFGFPFCCALAEKPKCLGLFMSYSENLFSISIILAGILFFFVSTAFSQINKPTASAQPPQLAEYSADSASCQQKKNLDVLCTYMGSAKFDQGETHLKAPEIIVYKNSLNQIYQIFALGNIVDRAYYDSVYEPPHPDETQSKQTTKIVNAKANVIKIFPLKNLVTLNGQAHIEQNKDIIEGSYIEYDINKQTVISTPQNNEHTTIILNTK